MGIKEMKKLTAKQQRFVEEYLKNSNGALAAKAAGYKTSNAAHQAKDLFKQPHIKAAIEKGRAEISERAKIEATDVLAMDKRIIGLDPRKLFYPTGHKKEGEPIPAHELDDDIALCIASIKLKVTKDGKKTWEYRFVPKSDALTRLYRKLGLFEKDTPGPAVIFFGPDTRIVKPDDAGESKAETWEQ